MEELAKKLISHFHTVPLGVAGRFVTLDKTIPAVILNIHTTSPEKAEQVAEIAWQSIPESLRVELKATKLGFAVRMI